MRGGYRFSLATNAERVCAEIMLKQKIERDDDSKKSHHALTDVFPKTSAQLLAERGLTLRNDDQYLGPLPSQASHLVRCLAGKIQTVALR